MNASFGFLEFKTPKAYSRQGIMFKKRLWRRFCGLVDGRIQFKFKKYVPIRGKSSFET